MIAVLARGKAKRRGVVGAEILRSQQRWGADSDLWDLRLELQGGRWAARETAVG